MYNRHQLKELFEKEAVFIGQQDTVPLYRVVELFGIKAAGWAVRGGSLSPNYDIFGVGAFQLPYLTYEGFLAAATFANVEEIRDTVGQAAAWESVHAAQDALIPDYIREDLQQLKRKHPGEPEWNIIADLVNKAARKSNGGKSK